VYGEEVNGYEQGVSPLVYPFDENQGEAPMQIPPGPIPREKRQDLIPERLESSA
jgi:hypothetical protein